MDFLTSGNWKKNKRIYFLLLWCCIIVGFILSVLLLTKDYFIYNDGACYAISGKNLFSGNGYECFGKPQLWFPPLYPILIGVADLIVKDLEFAVHLVSIMAFLISIPLFFMAAELMFNARVACFASVIFVVNKLMLEISYSGFPHALDVLLAIIIIYYGVHILKNTILDIKKFFILGCLFGFSMLNRAENIITFFSVSMVLAIYKKGWQFKRLKYFMITLLVAASIIAPYVKFLHVYTGKWTLTTKLINLKYYEYVTSNDDLAREKNSMANYHFLNIGKGDFDILEYVRKNKTALIKRYVQGVIKLISQLNNILYGSVFVWLIVLLSLFGKNRIENRIKALLFSMLAIFLIIPFGNVLSRYFAAGLPVFFLFMAKGLDNMFKVRIRLFSSKANALLRIMIIIVFLLPMFMGASDVMLKNKDIPIEHKRLGIWMKNNIPDIFGKKIIAQKIWSTFYAGAQFSGKVPYLDDIDEIMQFLKESEADFLIVDERSVKKQLHVLEPLLDNGGYVSLSMIHSIKNPKRIVLYEINR
ncbi:MAG: glycosyltransferase family 39 protein [Candidatus Omnitrophica bacterium]|nr:glycosyltransferase family 39 protein [Candidatus Omnitrophota bacterium]